MRFIAFSVRFGCCRNLLVVIGAEYEKEWECSDVKEIKYLSFVSYVQKTNSLRFYSISKHRHEKCRPTLLVKQ